MENQIIELIESLKSNKRVDTFDKASTKQAIVIRLLSLLGWDIFDVDEVKPDHALKSVQVDYSPVSYTHLTLPTRSCQCRSRWSASQ